MIKIGKQVCMIATGPDNPRNGEGSFIRLKNGTIMYVFSRYSGDNPWDDSAANITAIFSYDEGETWSDMRMLFPKGDDALNNMCTNLLRLNNGSIALIYGEKYLKFNNKLQKNQIKVRICMRVSLDEGATWSSKRVIFDSGIYLVIENDRVLRLKNGRILIPFNFHEADDGEISGVGKAGFFYSDDDGETWHDTKNSISFPSTNNHYGLQETGVYEYQDGSLWAYSRTSVGCQYEMFSSDSGLTWSFPQPSEVFTSPISPMTVKKVGKYTLAILNPVARTMIMDYDVSILGKNSRSWGRTPLVCAVSTDDGKNFKKHFDNKSKEKVFYIEDDPDNGYCYTSVFEGTDYFLLAYYHSNDSGLVLNSNKIVKVYLDELEK